MSETLPLESCFSGSEEKLTYFDSEQPAELYELLQKDFPWVKREEYFSVSIPTYHEVMQEKVMTCCLPQLQAKMLLGDDVVLGARKFCLQSKTSYLRSYKLFDGEKPAWLPANAHLGFVTRNLREWGRPFPEIAATFCDYYFWGVEEEIESHFGLTPKRGKYQTYFGVTAVGDKVVRVKQYCYDEQNTGSDWDVIFMSHCKKLGRTDLL